MAEQDTIYQPNRISSGVIWLLLSFSRTLLFGFPLDPWNIYSQVLEHPRNIRYRLYLIEWILNLILYELATSTRFVLLFHFCFLRLGNFCRFKSLQLGCVNSDSSSVVWRVLPSTTASNQQGEVGRQASDRILHVQGAVQMSSATQSHHQFVEGNQ